MGKRWERNTIRNPRAELHDQVELIWRGTDPKTMPMKIETAELNYKEREAKVYLTPWSRLTRDTMTLKPGPAE